MLENDHGIHVSLNENMRLFVRRNKSYTLECFRVIEVTSILAHPQEGAVGYVITPSTPVKPSYIMKTNCFHFVQLTF